MCSVIITLGKRLYRIPEVAPKASISLISSKQCRNIIAQMGKFFLFMVRSQSEKKIVVTSMTSTQSFATQQKQVDKFIEEYKDIFTSPIGVPLYCQVKHSIELIPGAPSPNGPAYRHSLLDNEEIKHQLQEVIQKGHI